MLFGLQNQFRPPRRAVFVSWMVGVAMFLPSVLFSGNGRPWLGALVAVPFLVLAVWSAVRLKTGPGTVPLWVAWLGGTIGLLVGLFGVFVAFLVILFMAFSGGIGPG